MWVRATLVAFMLLSLTPVGFAAEDLSTDRPDFVESSDVLDAGRFQLELGLSFERDREGGVRSRGRSTPALLRIGLGHSLEARIETDGLLRASSTDSSTHLGTRDHGAADVALGLKWHTSDGDEKAGTPSTALPRSCDTMEPMDGYVTVPLVGRPVCRRFTAAACSSITS